MGLGWLPHSSRVEKSKSYTHAFSAFELKLHEWMGLESEILRLKWHVGCYCSLLHTNTNFRLLCLNVIFREPSPGLNAVLAVAPAPKISSWHRAKFWVSDFRLLVWSSWSNGHWWAYWCQSSSSPVWDLSYRASAWNHFQWSSTNPSIKGFFSGNGQSWLHQYQHCYLNWSEFVNGLLFLMGVNIPLRLFHFSAMNKYLI